MKKYSPDDIKNILREVTNDPQALKASGKTPGEMQKSFELLTDPETLDILAGICNMLEELKEDEGCD